MTETTSFITTPSSPAFLPGAGEAPGSPPELQPESAIAENAAAAANVRNFIKALLFMDMPHFHIFRHFIISLIM